MNEALTPTPWSPRTVAIGAGVLAAHAAVLWGLELATPTRPPRALPQILAVQLVATPPEGVAPPSVAPAPPPPSRVKPVAPKPAPPPAILPTPAASPAAEASMPPPPVAEAARDLVPSPGAPSSVASSSTGSTSVAVPVAAPAAAVAPPAAPPKIELPSASAAYLNNPPPAYPPLSRRLGEQGRVVLRVRIEPDGTASAAEIRTSSGYERLDEAALEAVLRWRYVPGKRDGVPQAMWSLVPIQFVLE